MNLATMERRTDGVSRQRLRNFAAADEPLGYVDGPNVYGVETGNPVSGVDPSGCYDHAGHYWTTYAVARIACLSHEEAARLAFWSQASDDEKKFDATDTVLGVFSGRWYPPFWATDTQNYLHSLSGSDDPEHRRRILRDLLSREDLEPWQIGFLIHALADSYAHTYTDPFTGQHAFPPFIGHAPSHGPDHIGDHSDKYIQYVRDLYRVLSKGGDPDASDCLQRYIQYISKTIASVDQTEDAESRMIKQYLRDNYDDIPPEFLGAMVQGEQSHTMTWDPLAGSGNMNDTTLRTRRRDLTMAQAAALMDMIKKDHIP